MNELKTVSTHGTLAEASADLLGNDGSNFKSDDGRQLAEIAADLGADVEYANRTGYTEDGEPIYGSGHRAAHVSGDPVRYVFPDGSAIVEAGDGWDIEGATPFSWAGA